MEGRESETEALVIGGVDYGEADRVVHLLTRHGRISAFAHGARKSRHRLQGAMEPFATVRASLDARRRRNAMPTLVSASVENARLSIRAELGRIALSSYVVELASLVAPEGDACDRLYALVTWMLDQLTVHSAGAALRGAFELSLVDVLGYRPCLEGCVVCGEKASPIYLDLSEGGILCSEHRGRGREIGPRTLSWMQRILEDPSKLDQGVGLGTEWSDQAARKLGPSLAAFYGALLDRPIRSLRLLDDLGR